MSGVSGHQDLILNRGAVPLQHKARLRQPYERKALGRFAKGSASPISERAKRCRAAGGAKPNAGGVGWRGYPLRTIIGADSGFRRTYGFHPRRASAPCSGLR